MELIDQALVFSPTTETMITLPEPVALVVIVQVEPATHAALNGCWTTVIVAHAGKDRNIRTSKSDKNFIN